MERQFVGFADQIRQRTLLGWVYSVTQPSASLIVTVVINGRIKGLSIANHYREDLRLAAIGDGCHGFEFVIPDDVCEIRSLDVYVANTEHRLQSDGLDLSPANKYISLFPSSTASSDSDGVLSRLLAPGFLNTLVKSGAEKAAEYRQNSPFPFIFLDDFLPADVLEGVLNDFPEPKRVDWSHHDDGFSKRKLAFSAPELLAPSIRDTLYFLNSRPVLEFLERLTGIDGLIPDPYFVGGGLHQTETGGKLGIHIDFNRHNKLKLDRRINLLLFLNKEWLECYGGALELWSHDMKACGVKIAPIFNRCVIFNTTESSHHGHPDPLTCPQDRTRKSLALYYYSNGRPDEETAEPHLTVWKDRHGEV